MKKSILLLLPILAMLVFGCKKEDNKTPADSRPKDIDGNVYDTVVIGTQTWMVQNLKTTKYNDGTPIITNLSNFDWSETTNGAYVVYDNDISNNTTYGKLYNWYAVNTGKLAPKGWHVPTETEWSTMVNYLGGTSIAGGKLKSTALWSIPNVQANNSSGFTGLPAGYRFAYGDFNSIGYWADYWTSTEFSTDKAWFYSLFYNNADADEDYIYKASGFSVRCIRD